MITRRTAVRLTTYGAAAAVAAVSVVLACGPFLVELKTVETIRPADLDRYARGEIGIVRPRFARLFLVQAYRRLNGVAPLPSTVKSSSALASSPAEPPDLAWSTVRGGITNPPPPAAAVTTFKGLPNYQSFENCLGDAFATAVATLKARAARFGAGSAELADWVRAQDAVFANCGGETLVLPQPAAATADPLTKADRAYQIAAAYFYAMQFPEAGARFRAIAEDRSSPWQVYGRYLAARSAIRAATIPNAPSGTTAFASVEADLRGVIQDEAARQLHESARGLLDLIETRNRPLERTRALAAALARSGDVSDRQLLDYQWLLDRLLGEVETSAFAASGRDGLLGSDDLTSWIVTMQDPDGAAFDRSLREWQRAGALHWLVAVLWKMPPRHPSMATVLGAAAAVPATSPAAATVTFLRVRLMARSGDAAGARALLAKAPAPSATGYPPEAANLLAAERFMLARTLDELMRSAPRLSLIERVDTRTPLERLTPVFDDDAGEVFSKRLTLTRLVEAVGSDTLPPRLRLRVAGAAFARAVVLRRHDEALKVAPVLKTLAPVLAKDLEAFETATDAGARHRAGVLLLLRTPGLHIDVQGLEDDWWFARGEAGRTFEHTFRRNWWCGAEATAGQPSRDRSDLIPLLYGKGEVPFPPFVTTDERATVAGERAALARAGPGPNYLATEAVAWARAYPRDPLAAEALALAVEGTRWGCNDQGTTALSRSAFQTLHKLFPRTDWARRTKYWY